jgi:hemoglobin
MTSIAATWRRGGARVFGGPADYTGQLGGYERMLGKHLRLGITGEQRFRFASLMSLAADDAGMPTDPEFRSALVAYLEWGTRLALDNSQSGAHVTEHAPVPRWGWGEAPPYQPKGTPG